MEPKYLQRRFLLRLTEEFAKQLCRRFLGGWSVSFFLGTRLKKDFSAEVECWRT
jgi:hypothetical protein